MCFEACFSLDRNFAVVYIAPSDSEDREFGERTALPPRESRNTVSRNLPGTIETSRGLCSLPVAVAPSTAGEELSESVGD